MPDSRGMLLLVECVRQNQVCNADSGALEVHSLPALVTQITDAQHLRVDEMGSPGKE